MSKYEDNLLIEVTSLGYEGEGIANTAQGTVFVPYALAGEKVAVKVTHRRQGMLYATLKKIIAPSPHRVTPPCKYFGQCGGCTLQHADYPMQLDFKRQLVQRNLKKTGCLDAEVSPVIGSPLCYGYRNKLSLPVSQVDGNNVYGLYKSNSHQIVDIDECLISGDWTQQLIAAVKEFCVKFDIKGYNQQNNSGLLRHIVARKSGEIIMVVAVINGKALPHSEELLRLLQARLGKVSLYVNINLKRNNVISGEEYLFVGGCQEVMDEVCGIKAPLSPASFAQINDGVRELLYSAVKAECGATQVAVDAYSGAGTLTSIIAPCFSTVYGIEIVPQAVCDANECAQINNIHNVVNVNADCTRQLPVLLGQLQKEGKSVTLILDPPRKGCDKQVCQAVRDCMPQKVVYVSCNSATLGRDLALMGVNEGVYKVEYIQPFDMFAQTSAIETLVCLTKAQ